MSEGAEHSHDTAIITPGPGTSNGEADVHLRRVTPRLGLGHAAVTAILYQRALAEPAAHEDPARTHRLAVLHYRGGQTAAVY